MIKGFFNGLPDDIQSVIRSFIYFKRIKHDLLIKRYNKLYNKLYNIKKGELFHKALKNPVLFNLNIARETPNYYMFEPNQFAIDWCVIEKRFKKKGNLDYLNILLYEQICWKWIIRSQIILNIINF